MKAGVHIILFFLLVGIRTSAQKSDQRHADQINWMSFQEAVLKSKEQPKKIFIDMYTEWCGWCKRLDATTYTDQRVIDYLNKNYYAVRMDAEMKDTIVYDGITFVNPEPSKARSTHQIAAALMSNKMSFPTLVYLDENRNLLSQVPGYMTADDLLPVLIYFGENNQQRMKWEEFQQLYQRK